MIGKEWSVRDIMDYFGEFIDEEKAEKLIKEIDGHSYFEKMNKIRDMLVRDGYEVPFRAVYRRIK